MIRNAISLHAVVLLQRRIADFTNPDDLLHHEIQTIDFTLRGVGCGSAKVNTLLGGFV